MTRDEREELRRRIDAAKRYRIYARCENGWNNAETGYRHGCRCDFCKIGTTDARKARLKRRLARAAA